VQLCTRLHFREMLEPTGLWAEEIDQGIKPAHAALVKVLCRHLGLTKADDEVHRLAFSITGLAIHMFISREVVDAIRPQLFGAPDAVEQWAGQPGGLRRSHGRRRNSAPQTFPDHPRPARRA
jgi:hypothetical protein